MFNQMVLDGFRLFSDQDIENFKMVGYITEDAYEKVKQLRENDKQKQQNTDQTPQ